MMIEGEIVGLVVVAFMTTILILIGVSQLIFYIMKKLHPEREYGQGESCGGISWIDNMWFK